MSHIKSFGGGEFRAGNRPRVPKMQEVKTVKKSKVQKDAEKFYTKTNY